MKALFIGGTGTISSAIVRRLSRDKMWEVWLINRGNRADTVPGNVHQIVCDINDEEAVLEITSSLRIRRINISISARLLPIISLLLTT